MRSRRDPTRLLAARHRRHAEQLEVTVVAHPHYVEAVPTSRFKGSRCFQELRTSTPRPCRQQRPVVKGEEDATLK